jgi:hypothetical protein
MNAWHRGVWALLAVLTVVVSVAMAIAWFALPLEGITVTAGGETYALVDLLHGPRGVVFFFVAVAAVVIAIVAALSMAVVGIGFGALGLVFGLLTALASLVAVAAPFALIGWLLWRYFHRRPAAVATRP